MEEMFDIYDSEGKHLGVRPKSFCHTENPGVYHKPVWIWIIDAGVKQVLVQKRAKNKKNFPGLYDMPSAGHVGAGEFFLDAARRETFEELGIKISKSKFKFVKEILNQQGWEFAQIYVVSLNKNTIKIKISEVEVEEVKWLNFDDFKKLLYSNLFVPFEKSYKDFVVETLEKEF